MINEQEILTFFLKRAKRKHHSQVKILFYHLIFFFKILFKIVDDFGFNLYLFGCYFFKLPTGGGVHIRILVKW